MQLKNSTDFADSFLRRLVSWCCKQLELPVRYVKEAQFRNRQRGYSGHAWMGGRRICVSIGLFKTETTDQATKPEGLNYCVVAEPGEPNIYRVITDRKKTLDERTDSLVRVTAHECAHLMLSRFGRSLPADAQKPHGRRKVAHGGSEQQTEWHEKKLLVLFRANREALMAEWSKPEAERVREVIPITEKRQAKAAADLERWERKLKIAKGKVKKYAARVRYYERKAALKGKDVTP